MSPHLTAKLLKPASPLFASAFDSDDDEMVYSPYYRASTHIPSHRKPRRRSHQLTPEVRAEIVARVLDPAYSGRRDQSARVFVDGNGDAHDPDYQIFPAHPTFSQTHRRSQTASPNGGFFRRMPSEEELAREEDDADSEAEWARVRTASPYTSAASNSSTSPPPREPISLFGDDEWDEKEWTREIVVPVPTVQTKRRKYSKAGSASEAPRTVYVPVQPVIVEPVAAMEEHEHDSPAIAYSRHSAVELVREDTMDTTDDTPSCGYVLRRQWATFALHTRLSAHRIARRARRAVSVGT